MYLNEVLKLDKVSGSIKKIDLFLAGCNKKSSDYYKAFAYRNIILHSLGKTNDALKALYGLVMDFSKLDSESVIAICDAIISITTDVKRLDQARKYIDIKKSYLTVSNSELNTIDEINYAVAAKDYSLAISLLKQYKLESLTMQETTWCNELLAKLYYELKDFKQYQLVANELAKVYQESLNISKLVALNFSRLNIAYNEGNYVKVIVDGNILLNEHNCDDETIVETATLLIDSYLKSKDFRKASKVESDYEGLLDNVDPSVALAFCKAALELYNQTNSLVSIKHYQERLASFNQTKKKLKQNKRSIVIPTINDANLNIAYEPVEKVVSVENVNIQNVDVATLYVSNNYLKLSKVFEAINNLDTQTRFREIFRIALIELSKFIEFEEAYLLYYDHSYLGLHYKKERAYDKRLDNEDLEDTINFLAFTKEHEIFLDGESTKGVKDIVTKEKYETIPFGFCIPLFKEEVVYASIAFFASKPFMSEEMTYETLLLVSQMLNKALIFELNQNELRNNNRKMFFIYENMTSGIKELMYGNIHLSAQGKNILGTSEDLTEVDYRAKIHFADLPAYDALVEELYKCLTLNKSIEYRFSKNGSFINIRETFYPSYENGTILMYSLIEDISLAISAQNDLINLAYTNPTTKLASELKLLVDLKDNLYHNKLSLAVVDIYDFKLYEELYGINFANQLIYTVGQELLKAFNNYFNVHIYHLEFDRYAILFLEMNDRRTIENMLLKALKMVQANLNKMNSRVKLYFNAGIYRVSKTSNITDSSKVLLNAYEALSDAKRLKDINHHINHYDSELAKIRFNENQLVTHISEAIDHGRLGLSYRQVVDVSSKEIFAYYANVTLDNFEVAPEFMRRVVERRGLEELIDKYAISNVSKELKILKDSLKAKVYAFVELSNKTLTASLPSFIETQNTFFKTTKALVIFVVEDASNIVVKQLKELGYLIASEKIMDLYQGYIDFLIYDYQSQGSKILKEIKSLCDDKNVTFVMSGINEKEDLEKAIELDVKYLFGKYYKKAIRMQKVIEKMA